MAKKSRKQKQAEKAASEAAALNGPKVGRASKSSWKMFDRGSTIVSGLLAQRVATVAWRGVTGRKPPVNGRHPEVGTTEAVAWAMVGGGLVELVKVGVRRGAANYWVRSTGELPPGMTSLAPPTDPEPEPVAAPVKKRKLRGRSRDR